MPIIKTDDWSTAEVICETFHNLTEDNIEMSHLTFITRPSRYCGKDLCTVTIGGVGTEPQYRRSGAVREMLEKVLHMAPERGWAVSLLHPFSFAYYRKFGYERVADHKVLEFPLAKLDFLPRYPDLVPVNTRERACDCVKVYNEFAKTRNIMFPRYGVGGFPKSPEEFAGKRTYLWYDGAGAPAAFITLEYDRYYHVNRMVSQALHVREFGYTSPESLKKLFGFLRMFDGEDNTVKIHNCAMAPEVDLLLRHYMHTTYTLEPDLMARVLDVPAVLSANAYPDAPGHFTVAVDDTLPFTRGVWQVEYSRGEAAVTRLADDPFAAPCDLLAPMPAFTQLMYGYDEYTPDVAAYMEGVRVYNPGSDFFRAFHKKPNGLFEHF